MSIIDRVLSEGAQISIPTIWCRNLAQSLQNVENRLKIRLDVVPREDKCLWIIILPVWPCTDASSKNLDIVGFDWHEDWEEFYLITVVGFRNWWYNDRLYRILLNRPDFVADIENQYQNCRFDRQVRINKIQNNIYATIKSYDTLDDYISAVGSNIYFKSLTPSECIRKLNGLGVMTGDAIEKLNNSSRSDYNWLEYLHIVSKTPINCKGFLENDPQTMAEFEKQIEQYLRGMLLIDKIYK